MPVAMILAAAVVVVPSLSGWVAAGIVGRSYSYAAAVIAAASVLTGLDLVLLPQLGTWDIISTGGFFIAGFLAERAGLDRRTAAVFAVALGLAFASLEVAARLWLPPAPAYPAGRPTLIFEPAAWDAGCSLLYSPSVDDDVHVIRRVAPAPKRSAEVPLVVHLGDSMTYGEGVTAAEAFPALLDARDEEALHVSYSVWAVGTDFEYLLLRRIPAEHTPAMVVLHVYLGNDIYDIDRPYACCDAGALLAYGPDGASPRCVSPRWRFPLAFRLSRSPPPYFLRAATSRSAAARHLAAAFSQLAARFEPRVEFVRSYGEPNETGWHRFAMILAQMRAELPRETELVVDLLPTRETLEADDPSAMPAYLARKRAAAIAKRLRIGVIDAWEVLAEAVKRDGSRAYFLDAGDIHFSAAGHRRIADWLGRRLPRPRSAQGAEAGVVD